MKHQWQIRRQLQPYLDGQQRWDRAYQYLLQWTRTPLPLQSMPSATGDLLQEVDHENGSLRAGLDLSSDAEPDDRTTT